MELKFTCEHARGANIHSAQFSFFDLCDTLERAREAVKADILKHLDAEDRGEDFEREWESLADEARRICVGDVISFDEHHWRIICGGDDD